MTARATVLVVDDERGLREMLSYELAMEGFEVEAVDSGAAAVEAVRRRKFDLALTDLKMPGMDGSATVEALRSLDPDLEVIVATGYATVETAITCMKNGAYDYIQKPFDIADLALLLDRARQKSQLQGFVALYEASRALLATFDQSRIIDIVLGLAVRVLKADDVCLTLRRDDTAEKTVHRPPAAQRIADTPFLHLARAVEACSNPLLVSAGPDAGLPHVLVEAGCSSAVAFPLVGKASRLGALVLLRHASSPPFVHSELQRGCVFASQLTLSLENARVYQELELKARELIETREQLVRAEKAALAVQLAGAVAHELNTPLAVVRSNLQALQDYSSTIGALWLAAKAAASCLRRLGTAEAIQHAIRLEESAGGSCEGLARELTDVIDDALEGVRRITEMVTRFGTLAKPTSSASPERFAVAALVEECAASWAKRSTRPLLLELATSCETVACRADLHAAVVCVLEFLASGADFSLTAPLQMNVRCAGTRVVLAIRDASRSLSTEERARVFDPRLGAAGGQTIRLDTGLMLAQRLLSTTGAELSLESSTVNGLCFLIVLPMPADQP